MLWKCCTQMPANLENSAVPKRLKKSVFISISKKGNAKECSNYCTVALISHASKVMMPKEKWKSLSHVSLCDHMDGNPLGSSVHGILQARILEWVAISFSRGSSWPRGQTWVSCIAGRFLTIWATKETTICTKCYSKYFININPSNSYSRSKNELLLLASFHKWRNSTREN